ncbi:alpha/beta hydrolase [Roseibium aquae]|uniref:Alpha/beta hydrolase n=1 Tax=Roseibium aquae TaxID=1323746 RepID=A0A916TBF2_9HYPH|nr:alpha/beta hydrolase [Roseibium aquae]GGB38873.1 alpha/beta hydrolase [Roseibium aquae]
MSQSELQFLDVGSGPSARSIAVRHEAGSSPGVLWLSGFKSDMSGSKAEEVARHARDQGQRVTRFDYSGHGRSGGDFEQACLSDWLEETLAVFDLFCTQPTLVVGSSMGGWLAMLLALARKETGRIDGLVLIAPALDFTEELMWKQRFTPGIREIVLRDGRFEQPSAYSGEPYVITKKLIEDGRNHLLLGTSLHTGCPVTILQGIQDPDVPWQHAQRLVAALPQDDVVFTLVPDGDHRLSRPQDIDLLLKAIDRLRAS